MYYVYIFKDILSHKVIIIREVKMLWVNVDG